MFNAPKSIEAQKKWATIVERGAILLPTFEPSRSAGDLYYYGENGELDESEVVGTMPNTYYDKRFADWPYYSFSAWEPSKDEIGVFHYTTFDEDDGSYDDSWTSVEIEPEYFDEYLVYRTEKEFLEASQ